jgi:hypothetical protein
VQKKKIYFGQEASVFRRLGVSRIWHILLQLKDQAGKRSGIWYLSSSWFMQLWTWNYLFRIPVLPICLKFFSKYKKSNNFCNKIPVVSTIFFYLCHFLMVPVFKRKKFPSLTWIRICIRICIRNNNFGGFGQNFRILADLDQDPCPQQWTCIYLICYVVVK